METQIRIEKVGLEGQGVGHDDGGNVYFVPGALPGDTVKVAFDDAAKRYRDATLMEVIHPSADRRESPCPHFNACGGCDWLHWDYEAQLRGKQATLAHVLERASITPRHFPAMLPAPAVYGYRNRVQVRAEGGQVGFYRRRSHDIVDVATCAVADPRINEAMKRVREEYRSAEGRHKLELFVDAEGSVGTAVDAPHGAAGFAQVNTAGNERLVALVVRHAEAARAKKILELYCGNGNLTFPLLKIAEYVIAVDSSTAAIGTARAAKKSFPEEVVVKAAFLEGLIDRRLPGKLPPDFKGHYDTLVLDPPRSGVEAGLEPFIHPGLKNIIYVSCSPITFSKDVQCLKKAFTLEEVQGLDMFPHTRHIELVARFTRSSP